MIIKDSYLQDNILDFDPFELIDNEVEWHTVHHRGGEIPRLMTTQGTIENNLIPVYRHPQDDEPHMVHWTPTVYRIKSIIEKLTHQQLNHALIQKYRNGFDFIGEHSDKTLDITKDSFIINYSCGAPRTFELKSKVKIENKIESHKFTLHDNSMFVLGPITNRLYKHAIRKDPNTHNERISITFRSIATFYNTSTLSFMGQGALKTSSSRSLDELLMAFRQENIDPTFEYEEWYGNGFNCSFIDYK